MSQKKVAQALEGYVHSTERLNANSAAGLGIGVSTVNKLVNKMDGEIEIKSDQATKKHSEIEAGTKVTVQIQCNQQGKNDSDVDGEKQNDGSVDKDSSIASSTKMIEKADRDDYEP